MIPKWLERTMAVFWLLWALYVSIAAFGYGERYGVILPWITLYFIYSGKRDVAIQERLCEQYSRLCDSAFAGWKESQAICVEAQERVSKILSMLVRK